VIHRHVRVKSLLAIDHPDKRRRPMPTVGRTKRQDQVATGHRAGTLIEALTEAALIRCRCSKVIINYQEIE
jgi:hypothetical protein